MPLILGGDVDLAHSGKPSSARRFSLESRDQPTPGQRRTVVDASDLNEESLADGEAFPLFKRLPRRVRLRR